MAAVPIKDFLVANFVPRKHPLFAKVDGDDYLPAIVVDADADGCNYTVRFTEEEKEAR